MSKDRKVFTDVMQYLRAKHPKFANLLSNCSLEFPISRSANSHFGLTIIVPTEDVVDKLTTSSSSEKVDDVTNACGSVLDHLIRRCISTPAGWADVSIGNMRMPSMKVSGKPTSDKTVALYHDGTTKEYATITFEAAQEKLADHSAKVAVWVVTKGAITPSTVQLKLRRRATGKASEGTKGGYPLADEKVRDLRFKISVIAENEFVRQVQRSNGAFVVARGSVSEGGIRMDAFAGKVARTCSYFVYAWALAEYIYQKDRDLFFSRVLPSIRGYMMDFYILFEPHLSPPVDDDARYLLPTALIRGWWETYHAKDEQKSPCDYRKWIDERIREAQNDDTFKTYGIYADLTPVAGYVDELRSQAALATTDQIIQAYNQFLGSQEIDKFLPPSLAEYYKSNSAKQRINDEVRFCFEPCLIDLCANFDFKQYALLVKWIGDSMFYEQGPLTKQRPTMEQMVAQKRTSFVLSLSFLSHVMTTEMTQGYLYDTHTDCAKISESLYNDLLKNHGQHDHLFPRDMDVPKPSQKIVEMLRDIREDQVTPELRGVMVTLLSPESKK